MSVKQDILSIFKKNKELSVKEITDKLQVSKQMVHIALNQLLQEKEVEKLGRPPKTVYRITEKKNVEADTSGIEISADKMDFLRQNFLLITETGDLLENIEGFDYWCKQRNLPTIKTLSEFIETKKKYASYYDPQGYINGLDKLKNTKGYEKIWLDELYYLDFYAIERFGKTRLGTLLHYAKQGQNKYLMGLMLDEIAKRIKEFVKIHKADAIGFVPPTIRREVQIMKFLQTNLQIALPVIAINKLSGIIPVPQKSLSKLDERIRNAENTFAITDQRKFKHVVLIDDAVGSGSTLNQIAGKIKNKKVASKVTGLAIVGSFKGFDVITDV
jgi:orotate phosphoribosyltransferase-like protein